MFDSPSFGSPNPTDLVNWEISLQSAHNGLRYGRFAGLSGCIRQAGHVERQLFDLPAFAKKPNRGWYEKGLFSGSKSCDTLAVARCLVTPSFSWGGGTDLPQHSRVDMARLLAGPSRQTATRATDGTNTKEIGGVGGRRFCDLYGNLVISEETDSMAANGANQCERMREQPTPQRSGRKARLSKSFVNKKVLAGGASKSARPTTGSVIAGAAVWAIAPRTLSDKRRNYVPSIPTCGTRTAVCMTPVPA